VGWTVLLMVAVLATRAAEIAGGRARPSEFPSGTPHGGDRYWRLNRAHMNCLENLPLFAAVVLTGAVIGADSPRLDQLALVFLGARVAQSAVHVASGSDAAVNVRFAFFAVQIVCLIWMIAITYPIRAL